MKISSGYSGDKEGFWIPVREEKENGYKTILFRYNPVRQQIEIVRKGKVIIKSLPDIVNDFLTDTFPAS